MSPGGLDSAGTAGSDETGASVGVDLPEPGRLGSGLDGADVPTVEADEHAASRAPQISIAAASVVKRGIVHIRSSSMRWVYVAEDEGSMRTELPGRISHPTLMKRCDTRPKMRILVVEDELKMARAVRRGLEEEGYAVDAVSDGEDALHRALYEDYDAIVLDVMLPGRDGFAVCRELRTKGRWAPVLMLTARDGVEDRIRGLDAGADDYLVKPFSFGELLARLRALVRRGATERPTTMTTDDVVLDPATHTVTRDDEPIDLTAREFALLEFLMRRSGEVISRSRILEHVWDVNYDGFSNVVDVYVGYLRKKLEVPFDRPFIRTVRGVGYGVGLP